MTTEKFTQCPHCKASFKVSSDQLAVANGRVRCGACMNIFDANAYSISHSATPDQQNSFDEPPIDLEESLLAKDEDQYTLDEEYPLFQDNPEEDKKESNYAASGNMSEELSTSFIELDEDSSNQDPYITEVVEIETQEEDESWAREVLEIAASEDAEKVEPEITPLENEDDINISAHEYQQDGYESLAYAPDEQDPIRRHRGLTTLFAVVNIALLITLLAQASWFHYETLAKYPQIATLFEQACSLLKCQPPVLADISRIHNHNLIVRSHPTTRKALIIDTIIKNDANFSQAFPDIALYFSDLNNRTIAQRLIHPEEYLSGDLLTWQEMPPAQPVHISMEILDPGKEAVNYHIKFFSTQTPHKNQKR